MEIRIEEDIKRCKKLTEPQNANWIGISNQLAIAGALARIQELKEEDRAIEISMPLLTEKEMLNIDDNFNEIVNKIKNQYIKEKDLAIAQYIIDKQQKELEQKESILDKVTDKLKEDIKNDYCIKEYTSNEYGITGAKEYSVKPYAREILNIIEGEKK